MAPRLAATALLVCSMSAAFAARPLVLNVEADAPVTITGSGFRPNENVAVTVVMGMRRLKSAMTAAEDGTFTVRFAGQRLERCALPLVISAEGERSGHVEADLPRRECAAP